MTRVVTRSAGPTFQEDPEACELDLSHDPKAHPAEQVTRDGPVEGKRRRLHLACRLAFLVAVSGHQYVYVYIYIYMCANPPSDLLFVVVLSRRLRSNISLKMLKLQKHSYRIG